MKIDSSNWNGKTFRVANGTTIPHLGQSTVIGAGKNDTPVCMVTQVAKVTKPLASAVEIVDHDNLILLTETGGMVQEGQQRGTR